MRKIYTRFSLLISALLMQHLFAAQCATLTPLGTSSNLLTHIRNSTNPVAADKLLNTVVFIHRNNATAFGGSSGMLRYDVSTNNGSSWTSNQGVLNPLTTSLGRYPNVTIYNPAANTNTANAYVGYLAATINSISSAWNGVVSGVRNLNGTGNTENYNQPIINPQLIAHSVVKGAPGVFWAIDALFNGTNITGLTIYKGVWNSLSSDIVWSNNFSVTPPFNTAYSGIPQIGDYNIAFDPTGNIGWFSFLSHVSPGATAYAYYPVFYKTTNGGATWTGPIQVDLSQFSCMTSNVLSPNVPSTNFEHDLTVDVNGVPHLLTTICNGTNAYSVIYTQWHHMFDITQKNGLWVANDLANVLAGRATWGLTPNAVSQDMAPQATRSADGTKLFFTWTDNSAYTLGAANTSPNLYGKAYNVTTNTWTQIKEFTSCNIGTAGKMIFPHVAPEVLEPSLNVYKLAPVYGEFSVPTDPVQIANFNFLDNITFSASEFTVASPVATINIVPGPTVLFCPNSTVNISVGGAPGQLIWSTGSTVSPLPITTGSISTYSVIAQVGCNIGTASVTVNTVSVNASSSSSSICVGGSLTLSASGSATGYTWTPANLTGTSVTVYPTLNTLTLSGGGSGGCTVTQTLGIVIMPLPTLTLVGTNTICAGTSLTQTVSGALSYTWNTGATGATFTDTPMINTGYTVTGSDVNQCLNTGTIMVTVKQSPTVTIISTQTAVCAGQSLTLTATGASTYSWNGTAGLATTSFTPSTNTTYTLIGVATNLCQNSKTLAVVVYSLPVITVVPTKTVFCKGEKTKLTAVGALSYTWVAEGALSPNVSVSPTITSTYTVLAMSSDGCSNSTVYTLQVSACLGIDHNSINEKGVLIYPNPSDGVFIIKANKAMKISIINELGQTVRNLDLNEDNNYEQSVMDLPAGIYFTSCSDELNSFVRKIIITK